jgi:hypothetical protein
MSITLETFDRSVEKKSLIGPSQEALEISKAVRSKFSDIGLMYDMGHDVDYSGIMTVLLKLTKAKK